MDAIARIRDDPRLHGFALLWLGSSLGGAVALDSIVVFIMLGMVPEEVFGAPAPISVGIAAVVVGLFVTMFVLVLNAAAEHLYIRFAGHGGDS